MARSFLSLFTLFVVICQIMTQCETKVLHHPHPPETRKVPNEISKNEKFEILDNKGLLEISFTENNEKCVVCGGLNPPICNAICQSRGWKCGSCGPCHCMCHDGYC